MAKREDIRRFSAAELAALRSRYGTRSDLAKVRALTETDLEKAISEDPDFRDIPVDWIDRAVAVMPSPKKLISLRLDSDVVDWFKEQGTGYQTRINAVLRAFVQQADKHEHNKPR